MGCFKMRTNTAGRVFLSLLVAAAFILPAACGSGGGGGGGGGDSSPPTAPGLTSATTVSETQIDLSWTASTDDTAVTGYRVYRDGGVAPIATAGGAATAFSDTGLIPDTAYCYQVSAIDAASNESALSTERCATTDPDNILPSIPGWGSVSATSGTRVSVTWTASTDNVAVDRYLIYRDGGMSPITSVSSPTLSFTDGGLTDATQYCYEVSAKDTAGNESTKSGSLCDTTSDITPPTVPTILSATPLSATSITITWSSSTDNVAVSEYYIYHSMGTSAVGSNVNSRTFTSLTPGTQYCYEVSANDAADNESAPSTERCATTFTVPFVTSTVPAHGTTGVDVFDFLFEINFSEAMNTSAIAGTIVPSFGEPASTWSNGDQTVTLSFPTNPSPATSYTFTLFGAGTLSANGVPMAADTSVTIRTRSALVPVITGSTPADGATNVDVNTLFVFNFNDRMNSSSVDSNLTVEPTPPDGPSPSWNADFTTWTITTDNRLSYNTYYELTFGAATESLLGMTMGTDKVISFTTEQASVPYIVSSSPAIGATNVSLTPIISATFSEPMDTTWIMGAGIPEIEPAAAWWTSNDTVFTIVLSERFEPYTEYSLILTGNSRDAEGTAMGQDNVISFTTGGYDPFYVVSTTPTYAQTMWPVASTLCAALSSSVDASTLDTHDIDIWPPATINSIYADGSPPTNICFTASLAVDTTHHVTIFDEEIYDQRGNPLEPYSTVFSTGAAISMGAISGTITRDPDSVHDDDVDPLYAVLLDGPVSTDSSSFIAFIPAESDGSYQFSYLPDYADYHVAAAVDSARNGYLEPNDGDSFGLYDDVVTFNEVPVVVSGGAHVGNIDFTLYDSEAIVGEIYFGLGSPDIDGSEDPMIYAFTGDTAFAGSMWLTNDDGSGSDSTGSTDFMGFPDQSWKYSLSPFFSDTLSVEGSFATAITHTGLRTIMPRDYTVMATVAGSVRDYTGFAHVTASIAGTGDDAIPLDIRLEELTDLTGSAIRLEDFDNGFLYTGASVSLLGWPLWEKVSTPAVAWSGAPVDLSVAVHVEPDPADAGSYVATNTAYMKFGPFDTTFPVDLMVINRSFIDQMAAAAGTIIQPGKAQMGGSIADSTGNAILGAVVTISSGDKVYYYDTTLTSLDELSTQDVNDGAQWAAFNLDVPPSGKVTVTAEHGGMIIADAIVPLRAGEITVVDLEEGEFANPY